MSDDTPKVCHECGKPAAYWIRQPAGENVLACREHFDGLWEAAKQAGGIVWFGKVEAGK